MDRTLLAAELRKTSHILRRTIGKFAAIHGKNEFRKFDMDVIMLVNFAEQPVYQKDIEKEFELKKTTVSLGLDKMEKEDLILRKNVESDRRLKQIVLTKKALDLCKEVQDVMVKYEMLLMNNITKEEKDIMISGLKKIRNNALDMMKNNEK